jgi:DNA ligase-1
MKRFAALYRCLDETTKTGRKVECLRQYFEAALPQDAVWAVYFLTGRKLKRMIKSADLRQWCAQEGAIPGWLFEECYAQVGDLAETIALLAARSQADQDIALHTWVENLLMLPELSPSEQRQLVTEAWQQLSTAECLVWNKLLTGEFRVGVSQTLVVRALAEWSDLPTSTVAHRLMGTWEPTEEFFYSLVSSQTSDVDLTRPYPFCLAHPLQQEPSSLGEFSEWQIEWKWDGIRAQMVKRHGVVSLWSRGEELLTERFPEFDVVAERLPDGIALDGEIVAWKEERVLPFSRLQTRIGRKSLTSKLLAAAPVAFLAFDLLEQEGGDIRNEPLQVRRERLEAIITPAMAPLRLSPVEYPTDWKSAVELRGRSRELNVEGLMLKRRSSPYAVGRVTGNWWKWKVDPYTVDAVLVYAQLGSGRRAGLYTDYTFAIWNEGELVPFAKAYSGLNDEELREVDRFVRDHTLERFGPVRQVEPLLVFELAFERIQRSQRHKSGLAVRFPRIVRWRRDKTAADADTLERLAAQLPGAEESTDVPTPQPIQRRLF